MTWRDCPVLKMQLRALPSFRPLRPPKAVALQGEDSGEEGGRGGARPGCGEGHGSAGSVEMIVKRDCRERSSISRETGKGEENA